MPNRVKYLLLDVHGVLLEAGTHVRFIRLMKRRYGMDIDRHNEIYERHLVDVDTRRMTQARYMRVVNGAFGTHVSGKEYDDLLISKFRLNKLLIRRLARVKDYKLCIASDDWPAIGPRIARVFERSLDIHRKFYSFEYGHGKAHGLFKDILAGLDAKPGECLLIDDRKVNVEKAKRMGMDAVLFTTNRKLFADLRKRGVRL